MTEEPRITKSLILGDDVVILGQPFGLLGNSDGRVYMGFGIWIGLNFKGACFFNIIVPTNSVSLHATHIILPSSSLFCRKYLAIASA